MFVFYFIINSFILKLSPLLHIIGGICYLKILVGLIYLRCFFIVTYASEQEITDYKHCELEQTIFNTSCIYLPFQHIFYFLMLFIMSY